MVYRTKFWWSIDIILWILTVTAVWVFFKANEDEYIREEAHLSGEYDLNFFVKLIMFTSPFWLLAGIILFIMMDPQNSKFDSMPPLL